MACSPSEIVLPLPEVESTLRSGLILLQEGESPSSAVRFAQAFETGAPPVLRLEAEDSESLRLVYYPQTLEALGLTPGELRRPPADMGQPLSVPGATFVASVGDSISWTATDRLLTPEVPWEVPRTRQRTLCDRVLFPSWTVAGFVFVRPMTLVAQSDEQVIIGGHWTASDGRTVVESLLVSMDRLDSSLRVVELGSRWLEDSVTGLARVGPRTIVGVTFWGRRFRVDTETFERTELEGTLAGGRNWKVAAGANGFVVVYDGSRPTSEVPEPLLQASFRLDPDTLELSSFEAPEPITELVIVDDGFMIAASRGRLHHFDGLAWTRETELEGGVWVTDLSVDASRTRAMAVAAETFVVERDADGAWSNLPAVTGSFGIRQGVWLSTGEYFVGGAAGVYNLWDGESWCAPDTRPFSREFRALARSPSSDRILSVTYSESNSQPLVLGRMELSPLSD